MAGPDTSRRVIATSIALALIAAGSLSVVAREALEIRFGPQGGGTLIWFTKLGFLWVIAPLSIGCSMVLAYLLRRVHGGLAIAVLAGPTLVVVVIAIFARHLFFY